MTRAGKLLFLGAVGLGAYIFLKGAPQSDLNASQMAGTSPQGTPLTEPTQKERFRGGFADAVNQATLAHAASGGFVATENGIFRPANGTQVLLLERPNVDESQTSASKNKDIVIQNPITKEWETVRDVYRQSLRPAGIKTAELGAGGGTLSEGSVAKLASRQGSAFQSSASGGSIRAPSGSASARSASGGSIRRSSI